MIPLVKTFLPPSEELMPKLQDVLYSGYIAQGEQVEQFERSFENYIGCGHSLSLNSGTAALHIALILAGVKAGMEVISTALTAEPTNVAIKMVGAKIRYADIDIETGCISPESILSKINSNTAAIIVVDYAGIPVDVPRIKEISDRFSIPVIHDAAHSIGSKFNGKKVGSFFPYTVFSLQAIKHITTVDGGVLQIQDHEEYEKAKLIRWFGLDKKLDRLSNNITSQGFKYHMNNINATIGQIQLNYIDAVIEKFVSNGKYYDQNLINIPGLKVLNYYKGSEPSYWLYTIKVERRDDFIRKLKEEGIAASELHKRSDWHSFLNDFNEELPNLDVFYKEMVHIPCGWWVTQENREVISNVIKSGW
ncbi:MAG: DegT/DnrJ/EryC1/StrS family aminotransferase [Chitinophagaceae bacterium]|nr:DegT/DnrJ/EryC1/StrS family aminotransferase [Chitinophagaceae bacterium]